MSSRFLRQFICSPTTVGACWPSSRKLANAMLQETNVEHAKVVVELGPGTGAVSRVINNRIGGQCHFFAVELNGKMCEIFKENHPDLTVINDSASNLKDIISSRQLQNADLIVSSLPWSTLSPQLQDEILESIHDALSPEGFFTTFAYLQGLLLPSAHKFKRKLGEHFSSVERTQVVWGNLPPAFVYRCRK